MIQNLETQRFNLLRKTNALRPIAKLPADVLIEIFQMTCESTQNRYNKGVMPLLFGGICKDWREIAWSTPLLWSTVSINVSKRQAQVDLLREWLLRARSTLLSIYLTLDHECQRSPERFCVIFEILVTRVEYWQTFDCVLPGEYHDMPRQLEFPSLTSLSLRSTTYDFFPTMFETARFIRVEFSRFDLSDCNFECFLLERLRCFKMEQSNIEIAQVLALLRCARALKECYIDHIYPVVDEASTPSPTLHTELELLYVKDPSLFFLDSLTLPKLRVFTVDNARSYDESPLYPTISSLILRSSCHLERLNLVEEFPIEDDVIITFLETFPSLTHLDLTFLLTYTDLYSSEGLSDKLVSRLRPLDHGSCLLPRLTSLVYRGPVPCDKRHLVDMLSERWHRSSESKGTEGVSRLIRASIVAQGQSHQDTLDDVRPAIDVLVDEGMQLEIC